VGPLSCGELPLRVGTPQGELGNQPETRENALGTRIALLPVVNDGTAVRNHPGV